MDFVIDIKDILKESLIMSLTRCYIYTVNSVLGPSSAAHSINLCVIPQKVERTVIAYKNGNKG